MAGRNRQTAARGLRSLATSTVRQIAGRLAPEPHLARYNITASHERKFVWFRVAKVGTRTIYNRLKENGAELSIDHAFSLPYDPEKYRDYFHFAFVRNPWDRLVSCWLNKIVQRESLEDARWLTRTAQTLSLDMSPEELRRLRDFPYFVDWIERHGLGEIEIHVRPQSALIDLNACDFLGRMERFEDDLAQVFERIGLPTANRTVRNQSSGRKPYQDYYTPELADRVGAMYSKDVQMFGYRFEG